MFKTLLSTQCWVNPVVFEIDLSVATTASNLIITFPNIFSTPVVSSTGGTLDKFSICPSSLVKEYISLETTRKTIFSS